MPLRVNGKRPGPSDDQLLERLDDLWAEAVVQAEEVRRLEGKVSRQNSWLDANRDDPRYHARDVQWRVCKGELDRQTVRMREIANDANKLTEPMGVDLRKRAVDKIHVWAGLGGVGVYAMWFDLVPDHIWFETAAAQAEEADKKAGRIVVPF